MLRDEMHFMARTEKIIRMAVGPTLRAAAERVVVADDERDFMRDRPSGDKSLPRTRAAH